MSRKEKQQHKEPITPEVLLARILALRARLQDTISNFMDIVGKQTNVVGTESVTVKLVGRKRDYYIMFTPRECGSVKFGDLRAFSGWDLVEVAHITHDWNATISPMAISEMTVEHTESSDLDEWDRSHVQFLHDLSSRQAIDELLRREMYED